MPFCALAPCTQTLLSDLFVLSPRSGPVVGKLRVDRKCPRSSYGGPQMIQKSG